MLKGNVYEYMNYTTSENSTGTREVSVSINLIRIDDLFNSGNVIFQIPVIDILGSKKCILKCPMKGTQNIQYGVLKYTLAYFSVT